MADLWWLVALVCAFSLATSDALTKKVLVDHDEYMVAWVRLLYFVPVGVLLLLSIPTPEVGEAFYVSMAFALPLELLALVLYVKALKLSPLSLTLPFLALTPVFLLVVPWLILDERVTLWGAGGILLLAAGSYALHLKQSREGILKPFKAIASEKGSLYMIGVAFLYSITATLGKSAILASDPLFFAGVYFMLCFVLFTPLMVYKNYGKMRSQIPTVIHSARWPGIFFALMMLTHAYGISLTQVTYMISVKRVSLLIGVVYGYFLFKEENIRERILGGVLMLGGFLMIVLV